MELLQNIMDLKMRSISVVATTFTMMLGLQANAQSLPDITHEGSSVSLAYNFHNDFGDEAYNENFTAQLSVASRYAIGNGFGTTVTLGYSNETWEDAYYSERYLLDFNPFYDFGTGTVGLFYTVIAHDEEGDYTDDALYGITGGLNMNGFGVEAYAGVYESEGDFVEDTYGLGASYDVTPEATVYVAYQRDVTDDNFFGDLTSIGASYDLSGSIGSLPVSVAGQVSQLGFNDMSSDDDVGNQFSIIASYNFGEGASTIFRGFRAQDFFYD